MRIPSTKIGDDYNWENFSHGNYSIKSGYWWISCPNNANNDSSKLWSQNFWLKWKIFHWKLANGALASRVNLKKRKIPNESPCPLCENNSIQNYEI